MGSMRHPAKKIDIFVLVSHAIIFCFIFFFFINFPCFCEEFACCPKMVPDDFPLGKFWVGRQNNDSREQKSENDEWNHWRLIVDVSCKNGREMIKLKFKSTKK